MITVYSAGATDFSRNGLGTIAPESCKVTETLNGNYEVTIKHPYDEAGKYLRLVEGNIVRVPVPSGKTPYMRISKEAEEGTDIYRVETDGRPLRLRSGPGTEYKCLGAYKPGTEITVADRTSHAEWSEVVTPDGKHGWMFGGNLKYVRSASTGTQAEESIKKPMQLRDQPFRIYKIVPTLNEVTAYARHIFYDLADNMVTEYKPSATTTGAAAFRGLAEAAESEHEFNFYSDLDTVAEEVEIIDKNPAEAILDADGLIDYYGGELARDWWDVYLAKRVGEETQIQIREGKNLTGISYSVDLTNVATRIIPRGSDKDGKPLYLPEKYIDSQHIGDYPTVKWCVLEVKDAKEKTSGDDKRSKEECYALMREAAAKAFEEGADLPDVTLNVDFIDCADTDEYSQYKLLDSISIGDTVRVIARRVGVSVAMRMTQYTYDCLTKRYEKMTLGTLDATIEGNMINPRSIGSGSIKGSMIKLGGVGSGQLANGAVNSLKIGLAAIDYAHIAEATINQLDANAITAVRADIRKLVAGEITADQLYVDLATIAAAQITAANIDKANIKWAEIDSLLAEIAEIAHAEIEKAEIDLAQIKNLDAELANIVSAKIQTADIDFARVKDLVTNTAIITEGVGGQLYINRLAVTEANMVQLTVGTLMLKAADGSFVRLLADGKGGVKTETVQVEGDNVANATIPGGKLIENTITARELNVSQIFADKALIRAIKAANIDVADLFAASATITALDNYILRTSTIQAIEGKLDVWAAGKIELAVDEIRPGGRNLIRNTKRLTKGSTIDTWSNSSGTWFYDDASGFARGQFSTSGYTSDAWSWIQSPLVELPSGWQGRQVTFSTYIWSENWAAVDNGISISLCLSTGEKIRTNYGSVRAVLYNGGSPVYGSGVNAEHPLSNGKWLRISMTFTLDKTSLTGNPSNDINANTHMFITYWLVRNGGYRFYAPKLEWGNKATDWSPHPEEFEAGTNVLITKDQFKVKTPEFSVDIPTEDGTETMLRIDKEGVYTPHLEAPNVAPRYDGPGTLYVNPNATSAQIAAGNYFRSMADAFAALNEKQLAYSVTINLAAGMTEYGNVRLRGVSGPYWVYINGNSSNRANLVGQLDLSYNKCMVRVQYLNVNSAANTKTIFVGGGATMAIIQHCTVTGKGVSGTVDGETNTGSVGIYAELGSNVQVTGCELYDTYRSLYVQTLGQMQSISNKGNCTIGTNRSHVFIEGTAPCESTTWTVSKIGGGQAWVASNVTVDQGSKPSAPAVTTKTVSYKANNSDVYAGGGWNNYSAEDIYQGYTTALGEHRGCFWFDNATIRSALNGKTIKQATLTLYQMSGVGRNQPVQVNLEGITATSGTGSSPVGKPEYGVIGTTLGVNQATTFTLPTAVITDLVKGTINGLMLRTGETSAMKNDDNSYHYARFAGKATAANAPVLTVVYVE